MAVLPGIREVVVLGTKNDRWGEEVVAIVYGENLGQLDSLTATAKDLLGGYKAPKRIRLSKIPLPKTASGKIARSGLLDLFQSLEATSD